MWGICTERGIIEYEYKTYEEAYRKWEELIFMGVDCEIISI